MYQKTAVKHLNYIYLCDNKKNYNVYEKSPLLSPYSLVGGGRRTEPASARPFLCRSHRPRLQRQSVYLSLARHPQSGGPSEGMVLHGRLPRLLVGEPDRLAGPRCDSDPERGALGGARLLLDVGPRLRGERRPLLLLLPLRTEGGAERFRHRRGHRHAA